MDLLEQSTWSQTEIVVVAAVAVAVDAWEKNQIQKDQHCVALELVVVPVVAAAAAAAEKALVAAGFVVVVVAA